nr:hypothetical protein [Tanacetum cinerariifolium]
MMKGSGIGFQEKKAKLFNKWERFTSNERESIESYYHRFLKLMNDLKKTNTFQKRLPTKDLHTADYTQMYDFLKYNQKENVRNQVVQNAVQNLRVQNIGNQNGLIGVPGNANQNLNGNGNLQASTSGTQTDKAPVYDSDGSAEVHDYENCYDNEIFNMFTQEEQYSKLLEPIPEQHQVPQNDNNVIFEVTIVEQSGETVEQHPANFEETCALYDSLYQNLAIEVEKVNSVNRKLKETNANLTTELARFKNRDKCFEISQEKYDKLKRCYEQSVYQEQCLSKKINALYLSTSKQIMTLNEQILDLNKHLLKEKSIVSFLLEEKKVEV